MNQGKLEVVKQEMERVNVDMDITRRSTKIRLIIFFAAKDGEALYSQQKQQPVVDVTGEGSKVRCCKKQYCIGTWNVKSTNQGKLEVIKQEIARVNQHSRNW